MTLLKETWERRWISVYPVLGGRIGNLTGLDPFITHRESRLTSGSRVMVTEKVRMFRNHQRCGSSRMGPDSSGVVCGSTGNKWEDLWISTVPLHCKTLLIKLGGSSKSSVLRWDFG